MRGCWNISSLVVWLDFLFEGVQWNFSKYFLYWFMLSSCSPYLKKSFITFVNRIKSLMLVLSTGIKIYKVSFFYTSSEQWYLNGYMFRCAQITNLVLHTSFRCFFLTGYVILWCSLRKKNNGTDSMIKCYLELRINFTIKDNKKTLGMPCF